MTEPTPLTVPLGAFLTAWRAWTGGERPEGCPKAVYEAAVDLAQQHHTFIVSTESPHWSRVYDAASCGRYAVTSLKSCAARKLARAMVADGEPDGPIEARGLDGTLHYTVGSLHAFAKKTLAENPRLQTVRHQPFAAWGNDDSGGSEAPADV